MLYPPGQYRLSLHQRGKPTIASTTVKGGGGVTSSQREAESREPVSFLSLHPCPCQAGWCSHGVHLCGLLLHAHLGTVCSSHLLCHMAGEWHGEHTRTKTDTRRACSILTVASHTGRLARPPTHRCTELLAT